ncbi:uncharacterized protein LOC142741860 [Rhinoderma darwinii]|uniref:uncharacterized protein LOC142741860 n=1 Tax=Rhinoderma darwinii TaxID=43563 RepID=UPI003F666EB9
MTGKLLSPLAPLSVLPSFLGRKSDRTADFWRRLNNVKISVLLDPLGPPSLAQLFEEQGLRRPNALQVADYVATTDMFKAVSRTPQADPTWLENYILLPTTPAKILSKLYRGLLMGNLMGDIPTMEEPNISLQKFSVIKDMADEKSSDLSHSKYCDITSKNTKKSAFSLLTRLRSKNIRKRNFGSSAVIGARELDRYFPDRRLRLYVATWNMEGKDYPQNVEDLLLPSDDTKDIYVIGVQEGCPNRQEWEIKLQETLGPHYVLYHSSGLGVLYLTIFVRRELIWFCSGKIHIPTST